MPKLLEATLAEHRARQRGALVEAAHLLLLRGGYPAMTFSALAAASGLARPTIYTYFASRDDLAVAVCEQVLPDWLHAVRDAVAEAGPDPAAQVTAYVRSQLELAAAGRHQLARVLAE